MITPQEVKKLFELARIEVTDEELARFPEELSSILDYVAKLRGANLEGIDPVISMAKNVNVFREDTPTTQAASSASQFPEVENGYLKTKKVFGE